MGDKYFKAVGDLTPFKRPEEMVDYFRPAGDLKDDNSGLLSDIREDSSDLIYSKKESDVLTPFRTPQEIVDYFRPAGDLEKITKEQVFPKIEKRNENNVGKLSLNEINECLLSVVSGKRYDPVCELGVLMDAGRIITGLGQIMKMVDEGYNIVSATVINAAADMIEVEFQRYKYDKALMERRSRF